MLCTVFESDEHHKHHLPCLGHHHLSDLHHLFPARSQRYLDIYIGTLACRCRLPANGLWDVVQGIPPPLPLGWLYLRSYLQTMEAALYLKGPLRFEQ